MRSCTYRVLEYAKSELDVSGSTFIIVLRRDDLATNCIRGFVLSGWQSFLGVQDQGDISYIEDFLYDLRQVAHKDRYDTEPFLDIIEDLSTGPLRTASSGCRQIRELGLVHAELGLESDITNCSTLSFTALFKELTMKNDVVTRTAVIAPST